MSADTQGLARLEKPVSSTSETVPRPGNRVLVPVIRGQSAASLLSIGDAIARNCPSRGVVLSLVEIPLKLSGVVTSAVARSRELLRWIAASDYQVENGYRERLSIQSRYTTDASASIREVLLETQCDTVLAEWPPSGARRRHRLEAILRTLIDNLAVNLVVARPDPAAGHGGIKPSSVLVPLRGGANAWLALGVASALAAHANADLTLMHVYDSQHHRDRRKNEEATFRELADAAGRHARILEFAAERPADVVVTVGKRYEAVVMGAHANPARPGLVGDALSAAMHGLPKTVILARAATTREDVA